MSKRSRISERKKERDQSRQRNQQIYIIAGIIVIAVLAVLAFALSSIPTEVEVPTYVNRTDSYLTSFTSEGYPVLGNPNAPVEVREFSSFSCPGCLAFHETEFPQLLPEIAAGRMKFVFVPLTTGSVPNPEGANRAALCAGQQGKFWQAHDVFFSWQSVYGNSAFQDQRLRAIVGELSLNESTFLSCFNSENITNTLAAAQAEGVASTPTVQVQGVAVAASAASILEAVTQNLGGATSFESGLIPADLTADTAPPTVEATEAMEEATEAMEETTPEAETTEAAVEETTPEAEATEAGE